MASFQSTVMTIAIVLLIICLILIGIALYRHKYSNTYPPVVADCPDYWLDESKGDSSHCVNSKNLGNDSCANTMDFNLSFWTGSDGLCNKSKWAKACDLTWDGVTNNTRACQNMTVST
jgi:hypothetical protein